MKFSRRALLASAGGLAGFAAIRGFGQAPEGSRELLEEWGNHQEQFHTSVCQLCPGGCGILSRVVDGRLVNIAGNPLHPVNRGGLCMKGLAAAQTLYDPDRIRGPLLRVGERGAGNWQSIGWDEALQQVAGQLGDLREGGKAHALGVIGGQYRGLADSVIQRFCTAFGTPNYLRARCMAPEKAAPSHWAMQGLRTPLAYDIFNARMVLSFGCNLLESWRSTVHTCQAYGHGRGEGRGDSDGGRATWVQVEPRLSVSAAKADRWVSINPGTDGLLAMGLAYILIQERLFDENFVRRQCFGFEDWEDEQGQTHLGFRAFVLGSFSPESVAGKTGVDVETLFTLARDFARQQPSLAIGERGPAFHASDLHTRMAIHALNALVGNIGAVGGLVRQGAVPPAPWEEPELDPVAQEGLRQPRIDGVAPWREPLCETDLEALLANQAAGTPYGLEALFLYHSNPLYSQPDRGAWRSALDKVPLVVSFSPYLDESTRQADLVLPDHSPLERWVADELSHLAGITAFAIGQPALPPLYNTRQSEDVLLQLAQALGEPMAEALAWENTEEFLYERAQGLFEAGRGHVVMPPTEEGLEELMTRQGVWRPIHESYDDFWEALLEKGVWWDPNATFVGPGQLFDTPSGKFEFYSQSLAAAVAEGASAPAGMEKLRNALSLAGEPDAAFLAGGMLAAALPKTGSKTLLLNSYKLMSMPGGAGANMPLLQQQQAVHLDAGWESWLELNPETAKKLGVKDGSLVWVESTAGRVKALARIYPGAMPAVVNLPHGQGHQGYGRWADGRGINGNDIIVPKFDPLSGQPVHGGTLVKISRA